MREKKTGEKKATDGLKHNGRFNVVFAGRKQILNSAAQLDVCTYSWRAISLPYNLCISSSLEQ